MLHDPNIGNIRQDFKQTTAFRIEQAGKDGWAIEIWPTHEIDRTVFGNQRQCRQIADDTVI